MAEKRDKKDFNEQAENTQNRKQFKNWTNMMNKEMYSRQDKSLSTSGLIACPGNLSIIYFSWSVCRKSRKLLTCLSVANVLLEVYIKLNLALKWKLRLIFLFCLASLRLIYALRLSSVKLFEIT